MILIDFRPVIYLVPEEAGPPEGMRGRRGFNLGKNE